MDLNELYFRQQLSAMRAGAADDACATHYHQSLADGFARRIQAIQHVSGAAAARGWALLRGAAAAGVPA